VTIHSLPHGENEEDIMSTAATQASTPSYSTYDIKTRVDEVFAENGFAKTNDDGDIVRVKEKVVARVVDVFVSEALAATPDERVDKALTKEALYNRVFEQGPRMDDPDEFERAVADYIATYTWSMTTPSYDGKVQGELGNRSGSTDLMLCSRKIGGMPVRYVSRTDDLIYDDYVLPASEKLVNVAVKTKKDMSLASKRRPSLEKRVNSELADMASKAAVALGVHSGAPALESGK
jgi:hypothetical protein